MRLLKICHVTNVHGPFDVRIFHKMACSAVEYGHEVMLIAPHDKNETRNGVKIIPISKSKNRIIRFIKTYNIKKILFEVSADIYHFHDPELIPVMKWFHNKSKKKVIYDIHEYYKEYILTKTWIPGILRKVISKIAWNTEINASKTFECTISATEELSKVYEPYSKRNEFIINYDFKEGINFNSDATNKDIDIIHVGTLSKKRFEFLLDIAELLYRKDKNLCWYFIGVSEGLIQEVKTRLKGEYANNIHLVEKIPFEEVKKYYYRAKIGINYHPLMKGLLVAMPIKIFEYMKYGLAVITSDLPPIRRYIVDGDSGYIVKSNTVEGFVDRIQQIIEEDNFENISIYNKKIIYEKYNWETEANKLMKIYETL